MRDKNLVILVGNLGGEPKCGETQSASWATFDLATNISFTDREGNERSETDWHRIVAFNGLAKTLTRLGKGDRVMVEGRLKSRSFEKDGQRQWRVEVIASGVEFLRLKGRGAEPEES